MTTNNANLRRGDWVQVLSATEILQHLDPDGCLDGLPFMPEMLPFCGQRFHVSNRVQKTCADLRPMDMREFGTKDVVFLDDLRCSGEHHGGCQRACRLFWKAAWLRPVSEHDTPAPPEPALSSSDLARNLKTSAGKERFICQSTELVRATRHLERKDRLWKCVTDVASGNSGPFKMIGFILGPIWWKIFRWCFGHYPGGHQVRTPEESLGLQAGDMVEVKSLPEIRATLDRDSCNRGLEFSPDMVAYCGRRLRVRNRLDRMIMEATGEMRIMKNTVILENVNCTCNYVLGGCPRREYQYWREIWLRPVSQHASPENAFQKADALSGHQQPVAKKT